MGHHVPDMFHEAEDLSALLKEYERSYRSAQVAATAVLLSGGLFFTVAGISQFFDLTDFAVPPLGLPHFVGGIFLLGAYAFLAHRAAAIKKGMDLVRGLSRTVL